jgi:hypothetical protein
VRSLARAHVCVDAALVLLLSFCLSLLRIQALKLPLACLERENWIKIS